MTSPKCASENNENISSCSACEEAIENEIKNEQKHIKYPILSIIFAVFSIIFGAISLLFYNDYWYFNIISGVLGLALGILALLKANSVGKQNYAAVVGITLSSVGIIFTLCFFIIDIKALLTKVE